MLQKILNDNFSDEELRELTAGLGEDWENLPGTRLRRANALQRKLSKSARTHELIAAMDHAGKGLDLRPYLHFVIADFFRDEGRMIGLAQKFGNQQRSLTEPDRISGGSSHWLTQKAKELQKRLEEEGRIGELLAAIQAEARSQNTMVDLSFYHGRFSDTAEQRKERKEKVAPDALETTDEYQNFDISIAQIMPGVFRVTAESDAGEARSDDSHTIDLHDPKLNELLAHMRALNASADEVAHLGEILRKFLFPQDIWALYQRCLDRSEQAAGLRIRLRFGLEDGDLIRLPWEYCQDNRDFFALNTGTPLVRYLRTDMAPKPITRPSPVRILIATASPADHEALSVEAEAQRIQQALAKIGDSGPPQVTVKTISHVTMRDLEQEIVSRTGFQPHILHFIGHGGLVDGEGVLLLEDEAVQHQAQLANARMLLRLLRDRRSQVRVVVLNACLTAASGSDQAIMGIAPRLVWGGIPAVIAMQFAVPDKTAVVFAEDMYRELAAGAPLDEAMTKARRTVSYTDPVFWGIPVLFMRAPSGRIWQNRTSDLPSVSKEKPPKISGVDQNKATNAALPSTDLPAEALSIDRRGGVSISDVEWLSVDGDIVGGNKIEIAYHGGHDLFPDSVRNRQDLVAELEKLREVLAEVAKREKMDQEEAFLANAQVEAAILNAKKPDVDPDKITQRLHQAKKIIAETTAGVGAAAGLVTAFDKAIELIHRLLM